MQIGENMSWVDFVNLRAETYASEDNRIPCVEIGTTQQDAERRDFTINSLFYNLATKQVEDFTRRGIEDLENGRLRTPLNPRVTFLDDPLRVLRAVRFASRFNCRLDDDLRLAAKLEEVRVAFLRKVSRERVGKELSGMLTGSSAHPEHKTPVCYANGEPAQVDVKMWDRGCTNVLEMHRLISMDEAFDIDKLSAEEKHDFQVRILAAFLLPFRSLCVRDKRRRSVAMFVVQDSLKWSNREAKDVCNILSHVDQLQQAATKDFDRVEIGLLIRNIGIQWKLCLDVVRTQDLADAGPVDEAVEARNTVSKRYDTFSLRIQNACLDRVWELKPLLNGADLTKELNVRPGPHIKNLLDHIMAWQLGNPKGSRAECMAYTKTIVAAETK
ncbi:trna nucleotidyltransferase [Plasmopara halstedii]|uniref:Trna nucleotidyltransferase n=1 Tax=Plasmopara halstedii TaxID=4781 RepID=A0A0P1AIB8_PLAHL|nr:trna nucleotidyltransferase [Plasmopara halstedii]CEG40542.1 trna nucleotidyltransferase [Plasmopara halstedii]|eukprot:XP_024576911.1 trna nucleotidyltransferase [Plasmopara halstedii]